MCLEQQNQLLPYYGFLYSVDCAHITTLILYVFFAIFDGYLDICIVKSVLFWYY